MMMIAKIIKIIVLEIISYHYCDDNWDDEYEIFYHSAWHTVSLGYGVIWLMTLPMITLVEFWLQVQELNTDG